ncbi:MAG: DEAD/DEAH box helicase [Actinomycetota bacterium]|nr:DEAD/DEAH box helicase [Actinomycetota bacterium]
MAVRVERARWVERVSDQVIGEAVGHDTLARGRQYAGAGAVRTLVEGDGGRVLLATVQGSRSKQYQTIVRLLDDSRGAQPEWTGQCSCPMLIDCKHTAAVLITARKALHATGAPAPAPVSEPALWERALAPLVQPAGQYAELPGLALQLTLTSVPAPGRRTPVRKIGLRPLRQGKGKPWVKQGANWQDFAYSYFGRDQLRPDQRAVVTEMLALQRTSPTGYYGYGPTTVHLDDLGPGVWALLRRAEQTGMPLLAEGADLTCVQLGQGTAEVSVDVTRQASDQGLVARPVLSVGQVPPGGELLLLGTPPHGVAILGPDGVLKLWPLAAAPPDFLAPLLREGAALDVPAADVPRFLAMYYPVLARRLPVGSSDGSIELPTDLGPVLTLEVTYEPGHRVRLAWGFAYPVPGAGSGGDSSSRGDTDTELRLPLEPTPQDPPRDAGSEHRLLESLRELDGIPRLQHRPRQGITRPHQTSTLTGIDTLTFTTEVLPALQARDDVRVSVHGEPADYAEADDDPVVHLQTTDSAAGESDWFDLHVSVTVDDQEVPFEPLFAALARGEEVMLLDSGTWFSLDRPELDTLRRLIEEARELTDKDSDTLQLTRYQAGLWEELVALGVVEQQSARWAEGVETLLEAGQREAPPVPAGLRATLRPYQVEGYHWLSMLWDARLGGVLADDMGLGKTVQALTMAVRAHERGELTDPLLVVAPASVVGTWAEEAARFCPDLRVVVIAATQRRRGSDLAQAVAGAHVVVTSYTLLRLEDEAYRAISWSGLLLDEAQFVKNHRSRTYQAARRLGAPFTLAITGTPLENSLMDLWSMFSLVAPGLFPRPDLFAERYRKPIEGGTGLEQLDVLRRRVRPFMLRRTKEAVAPELPAKQEQTLHIALTPAHRRIYGQHLQRERQRVLGLLGDMDRNRIAIFRALTLLRQLSLDPSLVDDAYAGKGPSAKVESLMEQLEEVAAEGHRALVFSSFTGFLKLVRQRLDAEGIGYCYLDGSTRDRPRRIAAFRTGDDPVFLISLKAGGFGLTLTEADYVFILDPWWNPAAEAQAVDRTHRIGQDKPVMVYRMVSQDTIEEKVVALQGRKRDLFAQVVDGGAFTGGAISAEDIRDVLGA